MEVTLSIYLEIAVIFLATAIGFLLGKIIMRRSTDGSIIIEPTEDDDRERLIWKLDMELDDIKKRNQVIFNVENNTSKKSQFV
jgi:hypothetical protein